MPPAKSRGLGVSINIEGGAGLRARQYGPMAAAEGRPTGLPTFLTPTRGLEPASVRFFHGAKCFMLREVYRPPLPRLTRQYWARLVGSGVDR